VNDNATPSLKICCCQCGARLDMGGLEPFTIVACPVCGTKLRVPKRFDRYILEKICVSGGGATIYRAQDPQLSRRVMIKVPDNSGYYAGDSEGRFLAEAKLVAKLNHPGILPVYNCGVCEGKPYLVTRYMDRGDLGSMMKRGELPPLRELVGIATVIAEALWYANRTANVVHHGVTPYGIWLAEAGEVRLGDFDFADVRGPGDQSPCAGWAVPAYVSPERLYSGGEDARGDIFSLGVTIYELLAGRTPFGAGGETEELYERRSAMDFPALDTLRPEISESLSDLVSHMLDFEPDCRPEYPEIVRELKSAAASLR